MIDTSMLVHVLEAHPRGQHRVWLRPDDGLDGGVDLSAELEGEVFEPLGDPRYFANLVVDDTLL